MRPQEQVKFTQPPLILAGGCDGLDDAARSQLDTLRKHLAGVRGTVVGGGTRSGIAAIPGDLQEKANAGGKGGVLHTIGYLPARDAGCVTARIDERYSYHRHTTGKDFSPLEPLTFWEDFLASGGDPTSVKLLGFNGGRIAACEFRIALAFGAEVGIIEGSGRAADELLADPLWKEKDKDKYRYHPRLRPLKLDEKEVRDFLGL
jgi:hypothetical protein